MVINAGFASCLQILRRFQAINQDLTYAALIVLYFLLNVGYPIAMEWMWRGQSIGKKLFGLRVIDAGGRRLEFTQILLRNLLRSVDTLPLAYLVGGASLVLSQRCQRLGDMVANTVVVRHRNLSLLPIPESRSTEKFNSLLTHPHLAARLRQTASPELAHIALETILRRDELAPGARIKIFHALAGRFQAVVRFPDETVAGLADERYVRNCLEIVLNTGNLRRNVHHQHSSHTK